VTLFFVDQIKLSPAKIIIAFSLSAYSPIKSAQVVCLIMQLRFINIGCGSFGFEFMTAFLKKVLEIKKERC